VAAGPKLKSLRNKRNITVREVEQASRRIAGARGDKRFCISNGWLAQLENGVSEPSICKLFSLSVIYRVNFLDLVRLYNVDVDEREKYEPVADPYLTQLISHRRDGDGQLWPRISTQNEDLATTLMLEVDAIDPARVVIDRTHAPHIIYGHLGLADFTMYPMISPNALLRIDTSQNKVSTVAWHNEYERPIFFIELRDAYACGWCELQGNQLLIIPHQASPASVRRFTYPREAEIIGRVVGYSTCCVDLASESVNVPKRKLMAVKNDSR
jgi:transcriptional regulator with XRE-family HTH domain